ncbi:MAG TPA: hypothetical protein VG125_17380 [Pirellulales bacterium]|nr:hypothetical protein [Pirellulales bacterium]
MQTQRTVVPADEALRLVLAGKAPGGMQVRGKLDIEGDAVGRLPQALKLDQLKIGQCARPTQLPDDLDVGLLDISQCAQIASLPRGLHAHVILANGSGLTTLPAPFRCFELHAAISSVPQGLVVEGRLVLSGCEQLTSLPEGFKVGSLNQPLIET